MLKLQHRFVSGVRANTNVEYAIQGKRRLRWGDLHITQSELDGACGIVVVAQAAMLLAGIRRDDVEEMSSAKGGPLNALWALAKKTYFEGTTDRQIEAFVESFKPHLKSKVSTSRSVKEIAQEIAEAIDAGHVPIVAIESRGFSHWVLILGMESCNKKPMALLCLDASVARPPWGIFYNARCALQHGEYGKNGKPKKYSLRYSSADGALHCVRLHSLVVVTKGLSAVA
ncbi:MAG TPA: hypothetical protein PK060_15430 [Polaromonas sp.]|uniref:hypothetical protein n=1 Tax=unclassified Polaromonas TaxID=2638319 RepID=UPI000BC6A0A7|nr:MULTISPECIES: hypothetical protein [unclassified Polaromonas]OYZ18586.1 MAG: hypothetical protein B7Y28_16310 [Polaromonas sp. 16-63-31]HQT08603.1 hypothetical protein [Polaromonas sp.]